MKYQIAQLDLNARRGDTFYQEIEAIDGSTNTAFDFSAAFDSAKMQIRELRSSPILVELDSATVGEITLAAGKITLTKAAADMDIPAGEYLYDVQGTTAAGEVFTIIAGKVTFSDDVTYS